MSMDGSEKQTVRISAADLDDGQQSKVGGTASLVAVARAFETERGGIIHDPLARLLVTLEYYNRLVSKWQHQFTATATSVEGSAVRSADLVVLRARCIDDAIVDATRHYSDQGHDRVQVVMLGAGLDSRPWRLELPSNVYWFEVDMQEMVDLKQERLHAAGAETKPRNEAPSEFSLDKTYSAAASTAVPTFPLKVENWSAVADDFESGSKVWVQKLVDNGFSLDSPTVWVAEGLLYYLQPDDVATLLKSLAEASPPAGGALVASHMGLTVCEYCMENGHYIATLLKSWLSDAPEKDLKSWGWRVDTVESVKDLEKRYGVDMLPADHPKKYYILTATKI